MIYNLTHIAPLSAGKITAVASFAMSLVFVVPMFFISFAASGGDNFPIGFLLLFPFLYLIFGFVFGVLGAFVFNLVTKYIGGLQLTLDTYNDQ